MHTCVLLNRWAPNLDTLSWLLVDRVFMGAFADPGGPIRVLEFLLAMLQLANSDGRVEDAVAPGKGLLALARGGGRQVETYVQAPFEKHKPHADVLYDASCKCGRTSGGLPLHLISAKFRCLSSQSRQSWS